VWLHDQKFLRTKWKLIAGEENVHQREITWYWDPVKQLVRNQIFDSDGKWGQTTIEIENLQALKQHALDTRKTLKQLINEAIEEKIQRERQSMGMPTLNINNRKKEPVDKNNSPSGPPKDSLTDFREFLNERGLTAVIEKEFGKYFLTINDISPEKITPELLNDVREAITMVYDEETAEIVVEKLSEPDGV